MDLLKKFSHLNSILHITNLQGIFLGIFLGICLQEAQDNGFSPDLAFYCILKSLEYLVFYNFELFIMKLDGGSTSRICSLFTRLC